MHVRSNFTREKKISSSFTQHLKMETHICISPLFVYRNISLSTCFRQNTTLQNELHCKKYALQNWVFCGCVAKSLCGFAAILEKNPSDFHILLSPFFSQLPLQLTVLPCTFSLQCDISKKYQNEIFLKTKLICPLLKCIVLNNMFL